MVESRLLEQFEKMDAPQLRHLLGLLCDGKGFSLKVTGAKINVVAEKVYVSTKGIHYHKPGSYNFKDCENFKEDDDEKDEAEHVPQKSKVEIERLIQSNKRKYPDHNATIFQCGRCYVDFDIFESPSDDCLWHPGKMTTDILDIIWADHDIKKYGAIEDLIGDPDFEDRWVWSCCGELGSDDGCKSTRHVVVEESEGSEDSSDESEEMEEPPSKRIKH